jgi:hypothetical protein
LVVTGRQHPLRADLDAVCTRAHRPANFGEGMDLADALHLARSRRAAAFVTLA